MQVDLADSQSTTVEVAIDPGGRLQALKWTQRRSLRSDLPGWSAVEVAGYWGDIRVHQPAPTTAVGPAR
jgi:hypothetical protein